VALALLLPVLVHGQVLLDWHRSALGIDPAVDGAQAQIRGAEERVFQAQAAFGPTATASITTSNGRYIEAPGTDVRFINSNQGVLQITQPLIRNALFPSLDAARAQLEQAQFVLEQARADATVRLVEAVFDSLKARDLLRLLAAQLVAAEEQLAAARRSFTVGTTSITDVREAEAKIDTVRAQRIAADADFELRQQLLADLVGRPVPEVATLTMSGAFMPKLPAAGVLEWLTDAQQNNPQLQQAQRALAAAEADLRKAAQGHAPSADLTYSFTRSRDNGTVTSLQGRQGDLSQVGVNINIPLFASGATQSKVREAIAARDKAQSDAEEARRAVQVAVRKNFSAALSSVALARGLETANQSLDVAFRANRRGYEIGVKTNAEVLEAQSKVFEARKELAKAHYDAWLNLVKLNAAAGRLVTADVAMLDRMMSAVEAPGIRGRAATNAALP
jgi:outer membrane protein